MTTILIEIGKFILYTKISHNLPFHNNVICNKHIPLINIALHYHYNPIQTYMHHPLIPNIKLIRCIQIFKIKFHADDTVEIFKVKLVPKGYNQIEGLYYFILIFLCLSLLQLDFL